MLQFEAVQFCSGTNRPQLEVMLTHAVGGVGLEKLTQKLTLCPTVNCSVEDCSSAFREMVGSDGLKSKSRMNNGVVIFLNSGDEVSTVVERGVVIQDTFVRLKVQVLSAQFLMIMVLLVWLIC